MVIVDVMSGSLSREVPVWFETPPTRNWLARLTAEPELPGGIAREYAEVSDEPGVSYVVPVWLRPGTAVEFGAELWDGVEVRRRRWFGVVTQAHEAGVTLMPCQAAAEAVNVAAALRARIAANLGVRESVTVRDEQALGALDDTSQTSIALELIEHELTCVPPEQVAPLLRLLLARWRE